MIDKVLELYNNRVVTIVQPDLSKFMARLFDRGDEWYIQYGGDNISIAGHIKKLTITAEAGRLFITTTEVLA